jgi:hypothetical protein
MDMGIHETREDIGQGRVNFIRKHINRIDLCVKFYSGFENMPVKDIDEVGGYGSHMKTLS